MREEGTPWGKVYRICRGRQRVDLMSGMEKDGRITVGWIETMRLMMDEFFPGTVSGSGIRVDRNLDAVSDKEFEWEEIRKAVKRMRNGKAPGMDGLTAEMIQRIRMVLPGQMKGIYDECLRTNTFPNEWKKRD